MSQELIFFFNLSCLKTEILRFSFPRNFTNNNHAAMEIVTVFKAVTEVRRHWRLTIGATVISVYNGYYMILHIVPPILYQINYGIVESKSDTLNK